MNEKHPPEILAPVGSEGNLIAAVQSGANAVYIGGSRFSARAYADNFDDESMRLAIKYCHLRDVKVYVTINTLLKDSELDAAVAYASAVWDMGADALIVQDPGLVIRLRREYPDVILHASTQMSIHNLDGAKYYAALGFQRIVLARELTLPEIKLITQELKKIDVETEVFIHGAMCICYSGKCLMSSLIGGRSGNRGRCAQPCRRLYKNPETGEELYMLSPKDMSLFEYADDLAAIGVASLKIEGRMRSAAYVAEAVRLCGQALSASPYDMNRMEKIFNREGFNKGFVNIDELGGYRELMALHRPGNAGVYLGNIRNGLLNPASDLSVGDGLRIEAPTDKYGNSGGFHISKLECSGVERESVRSGEKVRIFPKKYSDGDIIYKTFDVEIKRETDELLRRGSGIYRNVQAVLFWKPNSEARIVAEYAGRKIEIVGEVVRAAKTAPLSELRFREAIEKSADSIFHLTLKLGEFQEGFLPVSAINKLRRDLIAALEDAQLKKKLAERDKLSEQYKNRFNENVKHREKELLNPTSKIQFNDMVIVSQKDDVFDIAGLECLIAEAGKGDLFIKKRRRILCIDPFFCNANDGENKNMTTEDCAEFGQTGGEYLIKFPSIFRDRDALPFGGFESFVEKIINIPGCIGLLTDNVGVYEIYRRKSIKDKLLIGDVKLNLMNSAAITAYPELNLAILSEEISGSEMAQIDDKSVFAYFIYGFAESMITEYPNADGRELLSGTLADKTGARFRFTTDIWGRRHIFNAHIKNNLDIAGEIRNMGYRHFVMDFTNKRKGESETRGAYLRPVL